MARIETEAALRKIYGEAKKRSLDKQLASLENQSKWFISLSPFLLISTSDGQGNEDVSPRGDAPGFVQTPDDHTLIIPDRPGNNRIDSQQNILKNPGVGLLFLIPGINMTLRVNGSAEIRDDQELRERFVVRDRLPLTVMVVRVKEVFFHCPKALMRSSLWGEAYRLSMDDFPIMPDLVKQQTGTDELGETPEEYQRRQEQMLW